MTITKEDVADLRAGDEVELTAEGWKGVSVRGPLWREEDGELCLGTQWIIRQRNGEPFEAKNRSLKVIKRAPESIYVNHPRTESVRDDVIRDGNGRMWVCGQRLYNDTYTWWSNPFGADRGGPYWKDTPPRPWTLLVDGETKSAVS